MHRDDRMKRLDVSIDEVNYPHTFLCQSCSLHQVLVYGARQLNTHNQPC